MRLSTRLRTALDAATHDQLVLDLLGIEHGYLALTRELPDVRIRFALKACPVDEVLTTLAGRGAGFDAASPAEIAQALRAGAPPSEIHYGNTVKSDRNIAHAYHLGIRDFATDNVEDVGAIAAHAPGSRVFCRLSTSGEGAVWGLSRKFGATGADAVLVLEMARALGLRPSGLSVHVGSQQMTAAAWRAAADRLAGVLVSLRDRGIELDHVNLGGGLPALGYLDRSGVPLDAPLDEILTAVRDGITRLRQVAGDIAVVLEPGRHLVADHGAIRAHVARLTTRHRAHWLYLSCGKFNGLYEMDQLNYHLLFPGHTTTDRVRAVIAGPTCDSDDTFSGIHQVPRTLTSGDPVWLTSCGAYSTSYTTVGFNGFRPLPITFLRSEQCVAA